MNILVSRSLALILVVLATGCASKSQLHDSERIIDVQALSIRKMQNEIFTYRSDIQSLKSEAILQRQQLRLLHEKLDTVRFVVTPNSVHVLPSEGWQVGATRSGS